MKFVEHKKELSEFRFSLIWLKC